MKYLIGAVAGILFLILMLYFIPVTEYKVYDCGMAEWHPDIPSDVKEECRRLRSKPPGVTI